MHDKVDTQKRFAEALTLADPQVQIDFLYPVDHYLGRSVPELVAQISDPLVIDQVPTYDGFIITGAPLEQKEFTEVTYYDEMIALLDQLKAQQVPTLFVCWGAMIAMHHYYGIDKHPLASKLFGAYSHQILQPTPLLDGLQSGFMAPHARYAEMDRDQIAMTNDLVVNAVASNHRNFLLTSREAPFIFLFSHLEYGQRAFLKEYQREVQAAKDPQALIARPVNYYLHLGEPVYSWQTVSQRFFENWLTQVKGEIKIWLTKSITQ